MNEQSIELLVLDIVTKQEGNGTRGCWVKVATVDADRIAYHLIAIVADPKLVDALAMARDLHTRLHVPASFFARDDDTKNDLLRQALTARWG